MSGGVIRVIDFETTGLAPPEDVIEVGFCDVAHYERGGHSIDPPRTYLCGTNRPLAPENRAVHHIHPDDLFGAEPYDPADLVLGSLHYCEALAAHNADFEKQWLQMDEQLPLVCTYKAALRVWPEAPGHSNQVLRYWLEDQGLISVSPENASPPHRAGPDAYVTAHILGAILETGATLADLFAWTAEPALLPTCPIGKWKGTPWDQIEAGYLRWMTGQPDMAPDLKWNATRELERRAAQ